MYKKYLVIIDGLKIGIIDLLPEDVKSLLCDNEINLICMEG